MFQTDNNCLIILAENVAVINDDINISQEKVSKQIELPDKHIRQLQKTSILGQAFLQD